MPDQFSIGAVSQPLSTSSANTLLQDADPAMFFALDFWAWVINNFPGPRLLQAMTAAGMTVPASAVAMIYPWQPDPEELSTQFKFPLLACWRTANKYDFKQIGWESDKGKFTLLYALPPMNAGQAEQVVPILRAVEGAIRAKTSRGNDLSYTPPGGVAGAQAWGPGAANLQEIELDTGEYGAMPGVGGLWFPAISISGEFIERDMYVPGTTKFTGGDITGDLVGPDGTRIHPFVQTSTALSPTLTSLSATTGGHAGGTPVTLTGTAFTSDPLSLYVLFGNVKATGVSYVNATTITCTTPAVSGASVVGVTVGTSNGPAYKANAFTYT